MLLDFVLALNDSAVMGIGGTVTSFDDLTSVKMVSERIHVDYARRHVDTTFSFKNTGGPTTVTMGFPEEGYGDVQAPTGPTKSWFESFKSWVDGDLVTVSLKRAETDDISYKQWWVKEVSFAAGQSRTVRNAYVTRFGSSTNQDATLTYILGSGRPWHGKIGKATVTFDMSGLKRGTTYFVSPRPTKKVGSVLVWDFADFEPEAEQSIHVRHLLPVQKGFPQHKLAYDGEKSYLR